jgi:microtubule-associated protein-like 6
VKLLGFSPDGTKLVSVGRDDGNSVAVYDWQKGMLLASAKTGGALCFDVDWKNDAEFAICGEKFVITFNQSGTNLAKKALNVASIVKAPRINTAVCYVG